MTKRMRQFQQLWLALSITALAAIVVTPVVVGAQFSSNSSDFSNNSIQSSNNSTQTSNNSTSFSNNSTSFSNNSTQTSNNSVGGVTNPLGQVTGICQLLKIVLNIAMLIGAPIGMLYVVYAGFRLVAARGNYEALNAAKRNLMWTLVGIAIFIGVWSFVQLLANTLGSLGVAILGDCR